MHDDTRSPEEAARNEAIFRDANERIEELRRELDIDGLVPYLCECEEPACTQALRLSPEEYEEVRSNPRTFLVAPHHDPGGAARIVEQHAAYWVAAKEGTAGEIAEELDPRAEARNLTADRRSR